MDWEVSLMMWYWPGFMACPTALVSPEGIALIVRAKVQGQPTLVDRKGFCQSFVFPPDINTDETRKPLRNVDLTAKARSFCSEKIFGRKIPNGKNQHYLPTEMGTEIPNSVTCGSALNARKIDQRRASRPDDQYVPSCKMRIYKPDVPMVQPAR